jgi:DHA1 family bicyclomycin/chloramphenicol resistance-like MFS transporter
MIAAGWHAIFLAMVALGVVVVLVVQFGLRETVQRDTARIRPAALAKSYATLFGSPYFVLSSLVITGTVGSLYTLATVLPFLLMDRVGLSATEFGLGMLLQSGSFFMGSLIVRRFLQVMPAPRLVPFGLCCVAAACVLLAVLLRVAPPSFLSIMAPVGLFAFGIAFIMPAMMVASIAPFPHIAGAASSLSGFMQMGGGLVGGTAAAMIGEPVVATATVIPVMGCAAILSWLVWRLLPEPPSVPRSRG